MIMQLLAEATSMDIDTVGQLIAATMGAGGIGGVGYMVGKARQISVKMAEEYATKEDMRRLEREIAVLKAETLNTVQDIYARLNEQAKILYEINGKLGVISKYFNPIKKTRP